MEPVRDPLAIHAKRVTIKPKDIRLDESIDDINGKRLKSVNFDVIESAAV